MALPMVHLLAAWAWAQDKPELKSNPDYYLGAISPDAIHIRDGNDKSHKNEIHLNNWRTPDPDRVLSYWKTHHSAFDIGYGMHVLLDGQWTVNFRQNAPGVLMSDGRPNPEIYYRDTCVTDFDFYSQSPLSMHLMELAERGKAPEEHPLLTAAEIDAWRRDIVAFYRRPCPKEGPAQFIDCAFVEDFLSRCNPLIDQTYRRLQMMNETQRSILDRRSNRGFTGEALDPQQLQTLIDAAMAAPTARNLQEWHFIFVKDKDMIEHFAADFRKVMKAKTGEERYDTYDVFFNAPLVVFITIPLEPTTQFAPVDAGIAVQNLALSAHAMDLGSVIVGMPRQIFSSELAEEWKARFSFPAEHRFAIGIAIGKPTMTKEAHPIGENKYTIIG